MAAYDGIDFSPPGGVRSACARGLTLRKQGHGGAGLQPATVAWARRLAAGVHASPEKARKMNAWFARHGASPEENRARREDKTSPAWVAWLLWGGDAGRSWSARLVRQMDARDNATTAGRTIQGAGVKLDAMQGAESPWNVLAYEVALEGRGDVALSRADFDQCIANFTRWGKDVPVVLYHADTDAAAHPLARAAHAWIVAMRVGSMMRDGRSVATLEARFRWVNAETRALVQSGALAFGSVTLVQNGVDEESGDEIGSYLWSFSLTNNPALVDIPRIAAQRDPSPVEASRYYGEIEDRDDVLSMLRYALALPALASEPDVMREVDKLALIVSRGEGNTGVDADEIIECIRESLRLPALTTAAEVIAALRNALSSPQGDSTTSAGITQPMSSGHDPASLSHKGITMQNRFMTLAARLGIASASEEDAERNVLARAEETLTVRRQLGLGADVNVKDVEAKITALSSDAARVAVLTAENDALKVREADRASREVAEHIDALCVDPKFSSSRVALEAFARADFAAFSKAYPKPAATPSALTSRVTAEGQGTTPAELGAESSHSDRAHKVALSMQSANPSLSYRDALMQASAKIVEVQ